MIIELNFLDKFNDHIKRMLLEEEENESQDT
ncbi:hypothetical protein KPH14_013132, partial [Odynerus spinipes]